MVGCALWTPSMTGCMLAVFRSRMLSTLIVAVGSVLGRLQAVEPAEGVPPLSLDEQPAAPSRPAAESAARPPSSWRRVNGLDEVISAGVLSRAGGGEPAQRPTRWPRKWAMKPSASTDAATRALAGGGSADSRRSVIITPRAGPSPVMIETATSLNS